MPGPAHLLELKDQIPLSQDQIEKIQALFDDMRNAAIPAGERLIAAEAALEAAFSEGAVEETSLRRMLAEAHVAAGAVALLLEAIPGDLAAEITRTCNVPTIGIGAGKDCSGQVLVLHDMLDVSSGKKARFVRNFMVGQTSIAGALKAYVAAVKDGSFPAPEHCY